MLSAMRRPQAPELRLLLACARAHTTQGDEAAIRGLLAEGADWTVFVRKTVAHGLAGLAGHTLARLVPDAVPAEIHTAFQAFIEQTRKSNQVLLDELAQLVGLLAERGVETIPFKGPVLAMEAFGDLGLRGFRDLDFLIRDRDQDETVNLLRNRGYERQGELTESQFHVIHRLQGQEILFKPGMAALEPHTRLTSLKMALDVDYDGLWHRARRQNIFGHEMLTFAPEDTLLVLAIHGGKELWWDIKWACDVADFMAAHPGLDWKAIAARARAQGCYRMLLVATSLARHYLGAQVPDFIATAEAQDSTVGQIVGRILARWEADDPGGPPSNKTLSMDRLRLHDGIIRRAGYVLRTLFLPGPQHVPLVAMPQSLSLAYIPIGMFHDLVALPLYRAHQRLRTLFDHALAVSGLALALAPVSAETRKRLKRLHQAYKKAQHAVAAEPDGFVGWSQMGDALSGLKRYTEAIASYDRALMLVPDNLTLWRKRSAAVGALQKTGNFPDIKKVPEFDTKDATGWALRAGFLSASGQDAEAAEASDCALQLDPKNEAALRIGIKSRIQACDWSNRVEDKRAAAQSLETGGFVVRPFILKLLSDSEPDSLACARLWAKKSQWPDQALWKGERYRHDKIRIAYISTDLRSHPVGTAIVAPLEHHDKSRFEITAISLHPGDGSKIHERIRTAADRFVDADGSADATIAALLRNLEIDIAVDLNGLTGSRRGGILARRPAPLQVNYLGYPGTTAVPFIDYIIADSTAIPPENQSFYSEKIAYLPHSYLPYDTKRQIAETTPSRGEEGLPKTGFVFACFNGLQKISPEIFDIWMRLLNQVADSVLWLTGSDAKIMDRLRNEAAARGVAPERLVFAGHKKRSEDHLARHRLADLFLDTLPYNAHSTASDALWAGLPVLTCLGRAFQARVAAGLLGAAGLPEMITTSLAEYEERALSLARSPQQLSQIRQKLARNRQTAPLFDPPGFTRGLEQAYRGMWERLQAGLPPESFSIAE